MTLPPTVKITSPQYILLILALCACSSAVASEATPCVDCNRGYLSENNASETKKGTLIADPAAAGGAAVEEELTSLQLQARIYRQQGIEWQRIGNLQQALAMYQKAVQLDPQYEVAYNDLGVVYEAFGTMDRAEDSYLKAVQLNPDYLSACTNLALLYENKRDLRKAAQYWKKRAELGDPADPWTQKAQRRLEDIRLVLGEATMDTREQDVIDLMKNVAVQKSVLKYDEKALAKMYFDNAKTSYQRDDYVAAMKLASDAHLLDPSNKSIIEFIEKLQTRLLSR